MLKTKMQFTKEELILLRTALNNTLHDYWRMEGDKKLLQLIHKIQDQIFKIQEMEMALERLPEIKQ